MTYPNLLIIGAQKCGTTWLHQALDKSAHFWGSTPKELNFWNRKSRDLSDYAPYFADAPDSARYVYESTPHYFRLPDARNDIARNIREGLGDVPLLLMLRNPVARYLSAYTHNMLKNRVPALEWIERISDRQDMLSLGLYSRILEHYRQHFSTIHVYLYDDLVMDEFALIERICADLGVENDLAPEDLRFRANDKKSKKKKSDIKMLPRLSKPAKRKLQRYYREDILRTGEMIGRDLTHWLNSGVKPVPQPAEG